MLFLIIDNLQIPIPVIIISIVIVIVVLGYYFSTKQRVIRKLSKLPLRRITSLQTNEFSKVSGKALNVNESLIAPYSKRKCVYYKIKIEQKKNSGKSSRWVSLINEEKIQDFLVETSGDYVLLKPQQSPKNYLSYLVVDDKTSSGTFNDASLKFENLLNHYNINSQGFLGFNKQLRYTEGVIEIGERITVAGVVTSKTLDQKIEGYNYSKIVELISLDKQKLIITDLQNIKSKRGI